MKHAAVAANVVNVLCLSQCWKRHDNVHFLGLTFQPLWEARGDQNTLDTPTTIQYT